jgi:hypothetical protein
MKTRHKPLQSALLTIIQGLLPEEKPEGRQEKSQWLEIT